MVALFPDFYPFGPQTSVNRQLFVVFYSLDRGYLFCSFQFDLLSSLALLLQLEQLFVLGELLQGLPKELHALIVLVDQKSGTRQNIPCLFVSVISLQRLQHIVFRVSILGPKHVEFGASRIDLELKPLISTFLVQSFTKTVQRLLEILLFVL